MKRSMHFILAGAATCALVLVAVWVLASSGGTTPVAATVNLTTQERAADEAIASQPSANSGESS